jgi:hypothetical protein
MQKIAKIAPEEDAARFLTETLARIVDKCSEFFIAPSNGVKFTHIPDYMFTRSLLDDEESWEQ